MPGVTRYRDPELCDALAADYVTGRMSPLCRARLEQLCRREPELAAAVQRWSEEMSALQHTLPSHPPPAGLWSAIEARIGTRAAISTPPLWQRLWPWRLATLGLVVTVMILALLPLADRPPEPAYLAPLAAEGEVRLIVTAYQGDRPGRSRLLAQWTEAMADRAPARVYLWADGGENEAPVFLGEIGSDATEWQVSPKRWQALKRSHQLLVSSDPDTPTTPLLSGPCLQLHYRDS